MYIKSETEIYYLPIFFYIQNNKDNNLSSDI